MVAGMGDDKAGHVPRLLAKKLFFNLDRRPFFEKKCYEMGKKKKRVSECEPITIQHKCTVHNNTLSSSRNQVSSPLHCHAVTPATACSSPLHVQHFMLVWDSVAEHRRDRALPFFLEKNCCIY